MWTRFRTWFAELTRVYNGTAEFAELTRVYNQNTLPQGLPVSVQDDLVLTAHRRGGSIFVRFFGQNRFRYHGPPISVDGGLATWAQPPPSPYGSKFVRMVAQNRPPSMWLKIRTNVGSAPLPYIEINIEPFLCFSDPGGVRVPQGRPQFIRGPSCGGCICTKM